ncbi:class I SAM-dependent methyltransferase [Haloarchaeobius salinus]|uniref:class I SAM-dependent methyltransferase n=1 Tax=Haloarchaeobius salinus TaxID=1198298 RepID=UPI0021089546|nr:methyltransferase domain-containing protein [Haloarchaeobius salinus]
MAETTMPSGEHRSRVERSRRKWDFWSSCERLWSVYERDTVEVRRDAVAQLDLEPGDAVIDIGCGRGANFELLREAVGPDGSVLGVDYSPGMLAGAAERIEEHGWENVETLRADATALPVATERFDGALATTAVSAMPDVRAVVENVHDALAPGASFAVYDIRLAPSGAARLLNPLVYAGYRLIGNWNREESVLDELERAFADVELVETFALGTNYVAVARKAGLESGRAAAAEVDGDE